MKKLTGTLLIAFLLSGCAAIKQGHFQEVTVTTSPSNALCQMTYGPGEPVFSSIYSGQAAYNVRRGRNDIHLTCSKNGYQNSTKVLSSSIDPDANSMLLFGLTDVITQTTSYYPRSVHINLVKN